MGLSHNITYTHKIRYSTEQKDVCEKVWFLSFTLEDIFTILRKLRQELWKKEVNITAK